MLCSHLMGLQKRRFCYRRDAVLLAKPYPLEHPSPRCSYTQSLASLDDSHRRLIRFAARLSIAPISARLHTDAWRTARDEDRG